MQDSSESYLYTTPSSSVVAESLLFFDTFSHSSTEKEIFDLVQFPTPVIIDLIKIVPLGQPIEANIPGSVRLGATNPSNCEIKFFINDLSQQDADKMADLGRFQCSEKDTDFNPPIQVQTDGLLLRGSYRTLTLAIFGQIAVYESKNEEPPVLASAASPPAQTPASPVASERDLAFVVSRSQDQDVNKITTHEGSESFEDSTRSGGPIKYDDPNNDNDADAIEEYSSTTQQNTKSKRDNCAPNKIETKKTDLDYSNSFDNESCGRVSFEIEETTDSLKSQTLDREKSISSSNKSTDDEIIEWSFQPLAFKPTPLIYFTDPSSSIPERNINTDATDAQSPSEIEQQINRVKSALEFADLHSEEWVILIEDLSNDIIHTPLLKTLSSPEMVKFLIKQLMHGLDLQIAIKQKQTGFKARHLRAGIKLAMSLFQCGTQTVQSLLDHSIPHRLLELYNEELMTLPLRILIFKCLSVACDSVETLEYVLKIKATLIGDIYSISRAKKLYSSYGDHTSQVQKNSDGANLDDQAEVSHGFSNDELTCYEALIMISFSKPTTRLLMSIGNLMNKIRLYKNLTDLRAMFKIDNPNPIESGHGLTALSPKSTDYDICINLIQDILSLTKNATKTLAQPNRYLPAESQFLVKPNPNDAHFAIYNWLKYFDTLQVINQILLNSEPESHDAHSNIDLEKFLKLQTLCLTFVQQIIELPRGPYLLISKDICGTTRNLMVGLKNKFKGKSSLRKDIDGSINCSLRREEILVSQRCQYLHTKLAYNLKVISCIDRLFDFHRCLMQKSQTDVKLEPEKMLHQLYIISDNPHGLDALMKHFSSYANLDSLLRFLNIPDQNNHLEFVKETAIDYSLELIGTFFRLNDDVLAVSEHYLDQIIELSKTKDKSLSLRIKSLIPWLTPFDLNMPLPPTNYNEASFKNLVRVIRKSIPNQSIPFAIDLDFELPPKLITAVRILRQLCISPMVESYIETTFDRFTSQIHISNEDQNKCSSSFMNISTGHIADHRPNESWNISSLQTNRLQINSNNVFDDSIGQQLHRIGNLFRLFEPYNMITSHELKYHYGIMKLYEQEGLKRLLNTLRELVGNYPKPHYQSAAFIGLRGSIVISFIHSVIILLQSIIFHLIDARGSEFQDTSIIPVILEIYSLLCFVPKGSSSQQNTQEEQVKQDIGDKDTIMSHNYRLAQKTKTIILSILMGYTQMCLSVSDSEDKVISKSMWTKMLKEVIEFTVSNPISFHHGLDVLTKIIPAPLPNQNQMDSIDQEQLFKNINHRKLWSAHLHPLHQQLEHLLLYLSITSHHEVRLLLYYLCNQLCDLSSNAACLVVKIITDTLLSCATRLTVDSNQPASSSPSDNTTQTNQPNFASQNNQQIEDIFRFSNLITGAKEVAYIAKMILNLLSNVITNHAFESAFSNHLHRLGKKDEKLLANLNDTLKYHEDYRPGDSLDEIPVGPSSNQVCVSKVNSLIESIKTMAGNSVSGLKYIEENIFKPYGLDSDLKPPESLTKINLNELYRKAFGERFCSNSNLKHTYRLKVLMDLKSRETGPTKSPVGRTNSESSRAPEMTLPFSYSDSSQSHKPSNSLCPPPPAYSVTSSSKNRTPRPPNRADSFRSRPQNTSRPPSIHVDDFVDLYGDNSGTSTSRYASGPSKLPSDYRHNHPPRPYSDYLPTQDLASQPPIITGSHGEMMDSRNPYFGGSVPPGPNFYPSSRQSSNYTKSSKHMKMN